jgi:hypothetical protein
MEYKVGKYLNVCKLIKCGKDFYGRANRYYCTPKCKKLQNNGKTKLVNQEQRALIKKLERQLEY